MPILEFLWEGDFITHLLPPANEVCKGYVFTGVCLSTGGGVAYQHALQVVFQHALQQVSRGGVVSQHALQVSRPTPKEEF